MIRDLILFSPFFVSIFWWILMIQDLKSGNKSGRLFSIFLLFTTIIYFSHALYFGEYKSTYAYLCPFYTFATLSVYPLFFFYIRSIASQEGIGIKDLRCFIPALFFALLITVSNIWLTSYLDIVEKSIRFTLIIQIPVCVYYSSRAIGEYHKSLQEHYSFDNKKELRWLSLALIILVLTALISMTAGIIGRDFFASSLVRLFIPSLLFSVSLFLIGYLGFTRRFFITDIDIKKILEEDNSEVPSMQDETKMKIKMQLEHLFENSDIFKQHDIRIVDLAKELGTNRSYLSYVLNKMLDTNFTDFVNYYRIRYAKEILLSNKSIILEQIAEESGFTSTNSFLRAFKKDTGITPGQFRKQF